ncbi:MAG: type I glutamate--ammonia ligase [Candidatus Dormibacteraeota bacterium]|uniref:Glutamine synthetase n=1 Tax=Candidatus Amunia macphersoniae TaxID=3127014 RepID=A0A934NFJ1_9BACT|nr:type I glutamate--ammonia ligase [Candidatus Dormibacteraeota bacterium]
MVSRSIAADGAEGRELVSRITDAGVGQVHLQFSDVLGTVKTVTIPASGLAAALEHGVWFDGSSVEGFTRTAESDMYLIPDPGTLQVLPWAAEPTARLICWARTPDGEPYSGDPRGALQRAVDHAAGLGYEYLVGPEIEFFLLERDAGGTPRARPDDGAGYFDVTGVGSTDLRHAMLAAAASAGVEINSAHHEVAPGQHEVDLGAGPALAAADAVVTFRLAMQAVAQRAGLIASFMPKPFNDQPGSGMHVHQSLARVAGGNAFAGADDYGLSDVAKHFIAGQLHHAAGMCLVLAPLVNSYKRLVRGLEAPIFLSWARTNRGALVRVPHVSRTQAARVELRSPDPSCNPYLAFAVMLRCGLDGIERRLPLPPPVEEALYGFDEVELERRNVGLLPDNLKDAVDACADDEVVRDALGDNLADRFLEAKRAEWREYRGQVTGWELERYLEQA